MILMMVSRSDEIIPFLIVKCHDYQEDSNTGRLTIRLDDDEIVVSEYGYYAVYDLDRNAVETVQKFVREFSDDT